MTTAITAADVNKLRTITGAGMMDCKKALTETNGDFEAAIDLLRKKGQKVAANRSDRDAKEGLVIAKTNGGRGILVVLNCETDFVAKNEDFGKVADSFAQIALDKSPADLTALLALPYEGVTIGEKVIELVGKIGEKLELSKYEQITAPKVVAYNHPGNKLACIVGFNKAASDEIAKDVAMQVAAMAAVAVDKGDVDTTTLERELEIAREQVRAEGKPEDMVEKIAQGKLNKFYKESTLLNQEFIKDNKKTIRQYLQDSDKELTVTGFKRIILG
ncbi:MAG TPA: translation elongation factor Ts [Bacteroidia bacterium]|jgi:elongation factor Ts|nr:translation elongation factor Ts [Bacteroidia bacterium]